MRKGGRRDEKSCETGVKKLWSRNEKWMKQRWKRSGAGMKKWSRKKKRWRIGEEKVRQGLRRLRHRWRKDEAGIKVEVKQGWRFDADMKMRWSRDEEEVKQGWKRDEAGIEKRKRKESIGEGGLKKIWSILQEEVKQGLIIVEALKKRWNRNHAKVK